MDVVKIFSRKPTPLAASQAKLNRLPTDPLTHYKLISLPNFGLGSFGFGSGLIFCPPLLLEWHKVASFWTIEGEGSHRVKPHGLGFLMVMGHLSYSHWTLFWLLFCLRSYASMFSVLFLVYCSIYYLKRFLKLFSYDCLNHC